MKTRNFISTCHALIKRTATQIKLKYLRARRDIKKVRATKKVMEPSDGTNDDSDWYERDILEMEGKVKAKLDTIKPSVESNFSQPCLSTKVGLVFASKIQG